MKINGLWTAAEVLLAGIVFSGVVVGACGLVLIVIRIALWGV